MQKGKSKSFARYNASLVVAMAILVHFAFLGIIIKLITNNSNHSAFNMKYNNAFYLPFVIGFMVMTMIYYNNERTDRLLSKHVGKNSPNIINFIKVLSIIFIPVIIGAILSRK